MQIPDPVPGLVIRYSFLWSNETARGAVEGSKDRPCAIILTTETDAGFRVSVLPVTHARPLPSSAGHLQLTGAECRTLGLDQGAHWVVLTEINRFTWPGYDLRQIRGTDRCAYGRLPRASFERIVRALLALDTSIKQAKRLRNAPIERDD